MSAKLLKSTVVTGGMTLISRISGLVRDVLFASFLGASAGPAADAFYVAFRIPNLFRRFFGEGAFSQAFVPVMSEYKEKGDLDAARGFISRMAGRFSLLLFGITAGGVIGAPLLVMALAPGYLDEPDKFALTTEMVRITFPYMMLISLVSMAAGVLNSYGRFAAAAFTPVLLNLVLIAAAIWGAGLFERPVLALAWGVFLAGVIQLLFQLPFLWQRRILVRPRLGRHEGVSRVFRLMIPALFGSSVSQLNMVVNTVLASFLVTGSVSWLYYSDRLMEFPLGIFGIALATVLLPNLSGRHVNGDKQSFSHLLDWALRLTTMIALPATVGLMVLAGPILITLFFRGEFLPLDVEMTRNALWAFAIGLSGFILVKVLAPAFYAQQDTRTPAKIAAVAFTANIVLSLALISPLKHVGLALAISGAAYLNAYLLLVRLRQTAVYKPQPGWWRLLGQVVISCGAMGVVLYQGAGNQAAWLHAGLSEQVLRLALWIAAGVATYAVSMLLLGIRPHHLRSPATSGGV